ncbi:hypothetical protein DWB77_01957 [Streptomyces hundungensis]|uniref:Uncharacterized protein n=1 Tax=Streptomyces hundungensis TaxID=1077946 RepID=A0A387H925_9ACTN|nr:hypothetical protein [Streptomyces hundungensis]AYG79839.1 hypothetical protein DWB77_01957 [Streptomyces hundungensis]
MSLFEPAPRSAPGVEVAAHAAHRQPRGASARRRRRLVAVNVAVTVLVLLLTHTLDGLVATPMAGAYTLGMLLLSLQAATMVISALWYDRACRDVCDPHVNEPHGIAGRGGELL